jgi:hypothetical protein
MSQQWQRALPAAAEEEGWQLYWFWFDYRSCSVLVMSTVMILRIV